MSFTRRVLPALFLTLAAATAHADDLTTTGGKKLVGKLVGVDATGVTFTSGEAQVKVPGKDIVLVDLGNKISAMPKEPDGKPARVNEIELTDGSTIRSGKFSVKGRKIELELFPAGNVPVPTIDLPLGSVFSVMRGAEDQKNRDAWKKVLASRGKRDLYVFREDAGLNFVQGTILSGTDDGKELVFEKEDNTKANLLLSRATGGLVFAQPKPAVVPTTLCTVLDVFGNSLVAQSVMLSSEGATVTTVSGVVVRYPSAAALAKLDYGQGNVAYLSDLDPVVDAPVIPPDEKGLRLNITTPVLRDQGIAGEPLKFGNETFVKGVMIAPETVLTYTLNGDYREFRSVIGLPETTPDSSLEAKVTIEADGRQVFAEVIRRKEKPKPVVIDIKGVKSLRVIVEAELPVNGNRVILADARVQK